MSVGPARVIVDLFSQAFEGEREVTVTHNLNMKPRDVIVTAKREPRLSGYGFGGYGQNGYGGGGSVPETAEELLPESAYTLFYLDNNSIMVLFPIVRTGTVIVR
jgi:hypothetical protein